MTLTDEQLAEIRERLETLEKGGSLCGGWEGFVWASAPATDIRALLDEVERLLSHVIAARNFMVLEEYAHADRHLREATQ